MKILLITVAGSSTRFSRSIGKEVLKCIYYEKEFKDCLLYRMIYRDLSFDKYIIVGGYKFTELQSAINMQFKELKDKIVLVENDKFVEYGSGYSLYLGLKVAVGYKPSSVVFAEGDLWVDEKSFLQVVNSKLDVVTFNRASIDAQKSVVFYFDKNEKVHYLYDLSHNALEIKEPFLSIYNSGQIWKFNDCNRLCTVFSSLSGSDWQGTNLVFVQKYFGEANKCEYDLLELRYWLNCNTVNDFKKIDEVIE